MKIEKDGLNAQAPHGETSVRPARPVAEPVRLDSTAGTDRLRLSPEAQITRAAIAAAAGLPELRHDLVERARSLLEQGELGADAERLADAMIDRWLTTP